MKKVTKGMIFALIYTLLLSLLPQSFGTGVAEAATDLKSIELDNRYYVLDGSLYEDTVFLLGGEYTSDDEVGKLKLVAKHGNETETLISEEEFPEGFNNFSNIIFDGKSKFVLKKLVWENELIEEKFYTVNKSTLEVTKQNKSEFYGGFLEALEAKGYKTEEFEDSYEYFGKNDLKWIVFENYTTYDDFGNSSPGYKVIVNDDGLVKRIDSTDDNYMYFISNSKGDLYYRIDNTNQIVRVNDDGSEQNFTLPDDIDWVSYIDNQNRIYDYDYDRDFMYNVYQLVEGQQAEYMTSVKSIDFNLSSEGTMWYQSPNKDHSLYKYGYLDSNLNLHDLYTAEEYYFTAFYKNNILAYSREGYSIVTDSSQETFNKEGWVKENNKWSFYYKGKGKHKGWLKNDGKWYFLDEAGEMKTGWIKEKGKWYLLNNQGEMTTGWKKSGSKWYLLNEDGSMATGWKKSGGKWYLLNDGGEMETGWHKDGSQWYFLESSGEMKQGWLKDGNKWYLLQSSGAMATGWKIVSSQWYYFYSNGSMAANTTIGSYKLGSSGAWIK
ncbi:hypothetical protein A6P54_12925 [Bacillus sp. MKU004]|nr:hypothetical protein A6P54_12925 [Bacillus sp. MKU004]